MTASRLADIGDLPLKLGGRLDAAKVAYVTYGRPSTGRPNTILLTHGYTSSHLFADGDGASEGSWSALVGPGRAIDTDRYFVVSSNMIGSAYGSTAPRSIDPRSGRPYGPDFPELTLDDIVEAQRRLLESLGVRELLAVVGPSYGGFQAFSWSVIHPHYMRGIVPVVAGLRSPGQLDMDKLQARLATDPNWNGGHYYGAVGIQATMTAIREETLRGYGIEAQLAERFPQKQARDEAIRAIAADWARAFDGHSLLCLGRASNRYDVRPLADRIRAKVLYVLSRTDRLFPPSLVDEVMPVLATAGVDARYFEIDSEHGHLASGVDAGRWEHCLREFLARLERL